jgi:hypothetical protein
LGRKQKNDGQYLVVAAVNPGGLFRRTQTCRAFQNAAAQPAAGGDGGDYSVSAAHRHPYERYFAGSKILNDLLQPAVVALAFPLYEQLHQIRARWKSIITICFVGSLVAMITGTSVALLMGPRRKLPPLFCLNR